MMANPEHPAARVHAVLPAAGTGERLGHAVPKQYLLLAGKPVLAHAIEAVTRDPRVVSVTVALAPGDQRFGEVEAGLGITVRRVEGGATRAESVRNALRAIRGQGARDWALVHDAARPCLPVECLVRLLDEGMVSPDGALLAVPVRDTLKREGEGTVSAGTVQRDGLWAAQTPQLFPLTSLLRALEACLEAGMNPTDEAAAMERGGARPALVTGAAANIKITWPEDLPFAEAWVASRAVAE